MYGATPVATSAQGMRFGLMEGYQQVFQSFIEEDRRDEERTPSLDTLAEGSHSNKKDWRLR